MNIGTSERQISLDDVSPGSYILSIDSTDAIQNLNSSRTRLLQLLH